MKKKLMAMTLLAATAAFGEIWTITVPDGETKYLQAEVEAFFAAEKPWPSARCCGRTTGPTPASR